MNQKTNISFKAAAWKRPAVMVLSVLFLLSFNLPESSIKEEGIAKLERSAKLYEKIKNFSMDIEYSVFYDTESFTTPADKKTGKNLKKGNAYYQDQMGSITLINNNYQVHVNEQAEVITLSKRNTDMAPPLGFDTDTLRKYVKEVAPIENGYRYTLTEGPVEKLDAIFTKSGLLKKWRTHYREKMDFGEGEVKVVTQMTFTKLNSNPSFSANQFSESQFVSIDGANISGVGKYKNFYIINQLETR